MYSTNLPYSIMFCMNLPYYGWIFRAILYNKSQLVPFYFQELIDRRSNRISIAINTINGARCVPPNE